MEPAVYSKISQTIRNYKGLARDCLDVLKEENPELNHDTLYSILALEYQKLMKIRYNRGDGKKSKYWNLYKLAVQKGDRPGIILRISQEAEMPPCLIARAVLQKHYEEHNPGANEKGANVNYYLKNTSLIQDMDLAYEVFLCTLYDSLYSPLADTMRQSLGQQYEIHLLKIITELGLAFKDEDQLRKTGYDKTPDVKLEVPVAVDGFIINWIESKALFGEEVVHNEYMKNQYLSYWNRFGSGLVIYWFGYVKTIVDPNDKRFMIRTDVPRTNIIHINRCVTVSTSL